MYTSIEKTKALARDPVENRPVILCEYSHSMNNSNGNLHLYWGIFWDESYPRLQGGFIWDMIDQGLRRRDSNGREYYAYGGDFGDTINDKQFCINGMFSPVREPHPCVGEIKYLQQPAAICLPDGSSSIRVSHSNLSTLQVVLKVICRYTFRDLRHLVWKWRLCLEYQPEATICGNASFIDKDTLMIDLNPAATCLFSSASASTGEVFLDLDGGLAHDLPWASRGHVLVTEQFPLTVLGNEGVRVSEFDTRSGDALSSLRVTEDSSTIQVFRGSMVHSFVSIDKETGGIKSIASDSSDGNIFTGRGMLPNFTRATTDNDRGGMELVLDFLHLQWTRPLLQAVNDRLFSYEMHWRDHGLCQDAPPVIRSISTTVLYNGLARDDVKIESCISVKANTGKVVMEERNIYSITKDGRMKVDVEISCAKSLDGIPSLPRIGQTFSLNETFKRVKFFGRGPSENYPDRKEASKVGTWSALPSDMGYDYIVPSENGSRSDCRWVSFESDNGKLIVLADDDGDDETKTFSFSALLHTSDDLHQASHTNELEQRMDGTHPVHVTIDHRLMGLGGDVRYVRDGSIVKSKLTSREKLNLTAFLRPAGLHACTHSTSSDLDFSAIAFG